MEKDVKREYLKVYELGFGMTGIQSGFMKFSDKKTNEEKHRFPFIELSTLKDKKEIGQDLGLDIESSDFVKLLFANIESLEVLQLALDLCRKEFELQNKNIKE